MVPILPFFKTWRKKYEFFDDYQTAAKHNMWEIFFSDDQVAEPLHHTLSQLLIPNEGSHVFPCQL